MVSQVTGERRTVVFAPGNLKPLKGFGNHAVIAIGAVGSHLRIGSPLTALPATAYVAVQLWFITAIRKTKLR